MPSTRVQELTRFLSRLRFGDLPGDVVEKAKEVALHSWGVQLAASTLPWSKQIYRYVRDEGGAPQSTVVNYGLRTTASNAAFVNSSFAHGFEWDDNHAKSSIKAGCVAVPTALAIGERRLSSGEEFLTAIVAAFEIMIRLGLMIEPAIKAQGLHPTGATGAMGAAVIAGRLLNLEEAPFAHAIGGAASQRSGLNEIPPHGRGHLKRTFGGSAAANGIRAALLAREGLTGPLTSLDHGYGFARATGATEERAAALTAGLGETWQILDIHYKIYGQDGYIQPMSQAIDALRATHSFSVEEIDSVVLGTNQHAFDDIIGAITDPKDVTDAQFSANFSVALHLIKGAAGLDEYTQDNVDDPVIRELASRVHLRVDERIDAEHRRSRARGAAVTIVLKDGTTYEEIVDNLRQLGADELVGKFLSLSQRVLSAEQSARLLDAGQHLETVRDVSSIASLLVPADRRPDVR